MPLKEALQISTALVLSAWVGAPALADPVQGPNGHFYEAVYQPGVLWPEAKGLAELATWGCLKGHLVTITSAEEDEFVAAQFGGRGELWAGASQPPEETDPLANWTWVNGEGPVSYANWVPDSWAGAEPNDWYGPGSEQYLGICFGDSLQWNDEGELGNIQGYVVEYEDLDAPVITQIRATPNVLWAPSHKFVPVTVTVLATDNCDNTPTCTIVEVTSNEPENGLGDGRSAPDIEITGDLTVNLRAERSGLGDGRIYAITVMCADDAGNSTVATVEVSVPKAKKR